MLEGYFKKAGGEVLDENGWFDTGDVATIDDGNMPIVDRSKDVIKSGGEWISSIDIENIALAHPAVAEARGDRRAASQMGRAAAAHRGAGRKGAMRPEEDVLHFLEGKIAKWWMPDDVRWSRNASHRYRQNEQAPAPGDLQGLQAADGLTGGSASGE